jgi:hypothetical protein
VVPSKFLKKLIGAGFRDSAGKVRPKGVPTGTKAPRAADCPRKASAGVEMNVRNLQLGNPS